MRGKMPFNKKRQKHGHWEVNFHSGGGYVCHYINGLAYGLDDIDWGDGRRKNILCTLKIKNHLTIKNNVTAIGKYILLTLMRKYGISETLSMVLNMVMKCQYIWKQKEIH